MSQREDPRAPPVPGEDFELLAFHLLSAFVGRRADELDGAIETAQRSVCELLDLDIAVVWQWVGGSQRYLTISHLYRPLGGPPLPEVVDAQQMFPWVLREVAAGRSVRFSSLEELPAQAAHDRQTYEFFEVKSAVALPLSTGGGPLLGVLSFVATRAARSWPQRAIRRLELVARIFAGALGRKAADDALRESEERLQLAAESAGVGLWSLDLATSAFWMTDQARRHFALSGEEPATLERALSGIAPEDRARVAAALKESTEVQTDVRVEYRLSAPGGGERWLVSLGRARRGPSGAPESIMGVTSDITERKRTEEALHDLSRRLIRAHEGERALLARELHDDVSQRLAVLAIDVGRAELAARRGKQAAALREVREGLVRLSEDIHSLSYQLHPSVLEEFGLAEAIEAECDLFRRRFPPRVSLDLLRSSPMAGADAALCLFRVAQEALSNVARHARASAVSVTLRPEGSGWLLAVGDDGVGFDRAAQHERRSLGLASMRERMELVSGTLDIDSAPGRGTTVIAWVPAEGESE